VFAVSQGTTEPRLGITVLQNNVYVLHTILHVLESSVLVYVLHSILYGLHNIMHSTRMCILHNIVYIRHTLHYIAIFRERSWCFLRDVQLRNSEQNIVDGRVVFSDVVRGTT
jgi:hypothetical protein